jgi:hypothetical protein
LDRPFLKSTPDFCSALREAANLAWNSAVYRAQVACDTLIIVLR